jgi:hypothetical protein
MLLSCKNKTIQIKLILSTASMRIDVPAVRIRPFRTANTDCGI